MSWYAATSSNEFHDDVKRGAGTGRLLSALLAFNVVMNSSNSSPLYQDMKSSFR